MSKLPLLIVILLASSHAGAAGHMAAAADVLLEQVNTARASGRTCGDRYFPPAPPLAWQPKLGHAALEHSDDMAARSYFEHTGKDGSNVGERASSAGYQWTRIGENIAVGADTPEEAQAGWLASPGHCANIMNPNFTEMGAAYAVATDQQAVEVYWTQVFGRSKTQP